MSGAGPTRCPRCGAAAQQGQEYCLECGGRLGEQPDGQVARASTTVAERHDWAGTWLVPALLGLVIAVLGTGAAIAISGDGEEESAIPTATGGSLTVTGGTPTLTAPEPTTADRDDRPRDDRPGHDDPAATRESGRDHVAPRPARLDDRPPLAATDERTRRRGGPGEEGARRRPASSRRARFLPLREPAPGLLRHLPGRLCRRGGGVLGTATRTLCLPIGVPT